jgi:hypothetical protein
MEIVASYLNPWTNDWEGAKVISYQLYRCFEQIRNDVCLHNLPVRIVGNGGGFTYGVMGSTHHALEDLKAGYNPKMGCGTSSFHLNQSQMTPADLLLQIQKIKILEDSYGD